MCLLTSTQMKILAKRYAWFAAGLWLLSLIFAFIVTSLPAPVGSVTFLETVTAIFSILCLLGGCFTAGCSIYWKVGS